ncbi:Protein NLP6 [Capsicum baccatum]|uniref:Protein NLP6 n=1 Tax=Capsicum baccatum TaxID=33114 RepID=A0A2G2XJY9_CAPBA|nr:Protein NLP6 [Capsicum baccatum]
MAKTTDRDFWKHEWTKHGYCSSAALPITDYFNGAVMVHNNLIAINNKNNLRDYLAEGGVTPANIYTKQVIITAVQRLTDGVLGLPGRVYRKSCQNGLQNVQYYSSKEFPRLYHALHCNVRGTLALPAFETCGHSCVGVLELIMISQKINYAPEVDKVCKALEVGFYHFYYIAL